MGKSKVTKALIAVLTAIALIIPTASNAESDPFPGIAKGQEIPGTRVSSAPGESSESFNAGAGAGHTCPAGSGRAIESNVATKVRSYYCIKTWDAPDTTAAWAEYNRQVEAARAAAEAESRAWNEANPGKQKCVSYGPITDPDGGVSQGGVCANPVPVPEGEETPNRDAETVTEEDVAEEADELPTTPASGSDPEPGQSASQAPTGSGFPFTQVLEGQLGTAGCPAGFQAANGLIADAKSKKQYTECWPQNAWTAYQLGGDAWNLFKATGGSYDPGVEVDRRAKVDLLVARAKAVSEAAALSTPGIERCSSWAGFGESGRECSYVFVDPATKEQTVTSESESESEEVIGEGGTENEEAEAVPAIAVGLDSVAIEGTSIKVARTALAVTPDETEATAISELAEGFTKVRTVQRTLLQSFPRDAKLSYKVTSLTKDVCLASSWRVRITDPGLCLVNIEITDSEGNSYDIIKRMRRSF
jgi:hypothetical protein